MRTRSTTAIITEQPEGAMTTPGGAKDELRRLLHGLRSAAGLSTRDVGARAGWSQAKVSRLENGRNLPSVADTRTLAEIYGADSGTKARLEELANEVKAWSRRVYLNRFNSDAQERLKKIEEDSTLVRTYSPAVIPGLLQTPDYVRAIFTAYGSKPRGQEKLDADVALRLERQQRLGEEGRIFVQIFTEGVLGWMADSPTVMIDQLEHIDALDEPGVRVGIIPFGSRANVFPLHTWDIYDDWAVAFGTVASTALLTHSQDVNAYTAIFEQLEQMAVFGTEARAILRRAVERYRTMA